MSRFQKIFLASALVIVGFGVAKFLGQPVLPPRALDFHITQAPLASVAVRTADVPSSGAQTAGKIRLLPDSPLVHADTVATNVTVAIPEPPRLGGVLAPVYAANDRTDALSIPRAADFAPMSSAPIGETASSRGRLRNEAPRAVGVDPQSPAAIRRLPSEGAELTDPYKVVTAQTAPTNWSAPPLLNAGYTEAGQSSTTAITASYAAPPSPATESQFAPPSWPMAAEAAEPRTHIVVDGDSLERLASRYLSDPQRSREIYELNRAVLSAPDLLPIGAELKIPERVASTLGDRRGFPPNSANATFNREVGRENVLPARPASASQGIIPRAQLAAPVMVQ